MVVPSGVIGARQILAALRLWAAGACQGGAQQGTGARGEQYLDKASLPTHTVRRRFADALCVGRVVLHLVVFFRSLTSRPGRAGRRFFCAGLAVVRHQLLSEQVRHGTAHCVVLA